MSLVAIFHGLHNLPCLDFKRLRKPENHFDGRLCVSTLKATEVRVSSHANTFCQRFLR